MCVCVLLNSIYYNNTLTNNNIPKNKNNKVFVHYLLLCLWAAVYFFSSYTKKKGKAVKCLNLFRNNPFFTAPVSLHNLQQFMKKRKKYGLWTAHYLSKKKKKRKQALLFWRHQSQFMQVEIHMYAVPAQLI